MGLAHGRPPSGTAVIAGPNACYRELLKADAAKGQIVARYYVQLGEREFAFEITQAGGNTLIAPLETEDNTAPFEVDFAAVHSNPRTGEGLYSLLADGKSYQMYIEPHDAAFRVVIWRHRYEVRVLTEREWRLQKLAPKQSAHSGVAIISAPMPGLVKAVPAQEGAEVEAGARLVVLEAMKMENEITAPRAGKVTAVHVAPGSIVEAGKPLVTIE